jgi:hypothetical protein
MVSVSLASRNTISELYFILAIMKHDYASVVWNAFTNTDYNKLERVQDNVSCSPSYSRFFRNQNYAVMHVSWITLNNTRFHATQLFGFIVCEGRLVQ